MKIGVSSYSFSRYLASGTHIFDIINMAAEIGFEGMEFTDFGSLSQSDNNQLEIAAQVREKVLETGMEIMSYTIGADFLKPKNNGSQKDEVNRLKGELDIAKALGAPCMRHDVTTGAHGNKSELEDYIEALPTLVECCREVTEYGADIGVKTMFENHGYFIQDSDRCSLILSRVNHPNMGALVDIGNFLCADEDPVVAVKQMASWAFHVHAKDFHVKPASANPGAGWFPSRGKNWLRGAITGHGDVDIYGCLKALKDAGYDGFISIEFEGVEDNRFALETGLQNLKNIAAML